MEQFEYPSAPLILGFILGPLAETNLRSGLMLSNQSFIPFLQSPIALLFFVFTIISIIVSARRHTKRSKAESLI
jgi:putative tricarboxylic transport membrane protein